MRCERLRIEVYRDDMVGRANRIDVACAGNPLELGFNGMRNLEPKK